MYYYTVRAHLNTLFVYFDFVRERFSHLFSIYNGFSYFKICNREKS